MKKRIFSLMMIFSIVVTFSACSEREKEIKLTDNVRQEFKEEGNDFKVNKIQELDFKGIKCSCLVWKDDENIMAIEESGVGKEFINTDEFLKKDINIYNFNVKNSKFTKIKALKDVVCEDFNDSRFGENLIFKRTNKICMYNEVNDTEKEIYDLSDISKEEEEMPRNYSSVQKGAADRARFGFVKQTNGRYVYIIAYLNGGVSTVRIIDLNTGNISKGCLFLRPTSASSRFFWTYDKTKDSFYMSVFEGDWIYEFKLKDEIHFKKIKKFENMILDFCENGKDLYVSTLNFKKNKRFIMKYDKENNKTTEVLEDNIKGPEKGENNFYMCINLSNSHNLAAYTVVQAKNGPSSVLNKEGETKIKTISYVGKLEGNKIKNIRILTSDSKERENYCNWVIFNPKGDKFIYLNQNFSIYNKKVKIGAIKASIYEVKD